MSKFKFYGSKLPIFWNKTSEDRPSKVLFDSFNFEWVELPHTPKYLDAYTSDIVLKEQDYTYFKMENTITNETTYWFIANRSKYLSEGVIYTLEIDIYSSYTMNVIEKMNEEKNLLIGIERAHLKFKDYQKYILPYLKDDLVAYGDSGDGAILVDGMVNFRDVILPAQNTPNPIFRANGVDYEYENAINFNNPQYPVSRCYVFYSVENTTNNEKRQVYVFPILENEKDTDYYLLETDSSGTSANTSKPLGNTDFQMIELVKQKTATFVGVFTTPFKWGDNEYNKLEINNVSYFYKTLPLGATRIDTTFTSFEKNDTLFSITGGVAFPTNRIIFNNPNIDEDNIKVNFYSFLSLNNTWYYNVLSTPLLFDYDNGLKINMNGLFVFNQGFRYTFNNYDNPFNLGGELPSDRQSYSAYLNGIRETMNASIKASQDNMTLGVTKNVINATLGLTQAGIGMGQMFFSGGLIGSDTTMKGISNFVNGATNVAGAVVNHQNTINMFDAQMKDAKNSIPPSITTTNDNDLKIYLLSCSVNSIGGKSGFMIFKKLTRINANRLDNIAFLFGGKVSNYVPWNIIRDTMRDNNIPCYYISFMKDYTTFAFYNLINKYYPKYDLALKQVIAESLGIGFRIWKEIPDFTKTYEMIL